MAFRYPNSDPGPYARCPCTEPGKDPLKARFCCRKSSGWSRKPYDPGLTPSDVRVSGCYASPLGGCNGSISREHYASAALLRIMHPDIVALAGMPWAQGEWKRLPIKSLGSNILCQGHNGCLSGLDTRMASFFRCLYSGFYGPAPFDEFVLVSGVDIERWILKVLIGQLVSGNTMRQGQVIRNWQPPLEWLEILFGRQDMTQGQGLRYFDRPLTPEPFAVAMSKPHEDDTNWGVDIVFAGLGFHLNMIKNPVRLVRGEFYRPQRLVFVKEGGVIHFSWPAYNATEIVPLEKRGYQILPSMLPVPPKILPAQLS